MTVTEPVAVENQPRRRRRWVWWVMAGVVLLLAAGAGFGVYLWQGLGVVPEFYRRARLSGEDRLAALASVERKVGNFQDSFGATLAARNRESEEPTTQPTEPAVLRFSSDELDTYFDKWLDDNGYREPFSAHMAEPRLLVHEGALVLAGRMSAFNGTVVSMHFLPDVDEETGEVELRLDAAYAGRVTLPESAFDLFREKTTAALRENMPEEEQDEVEIDENGVANSAAVSLAVNRQLLNLVETRELDNLVLFPHLITHGQVAARVAELTVEGSELVVGFLPLSAEEREELLSELKEPVPESDDAEDDGEAQ